MKCSGQICEIIRKAKYLDTSLNEHSKIRLFSTEFKIISVIIDLDECVVKDIPNISGLSHRTVFDSLTKLEYLGIIKKIKNEKDKRFLRVVLNYENFHEKICKPFLKGNQMDDRSEKNVLESESVA